MASSFQPDLPSDNLETTSESAATKVFGVPELLEMVLLRLPMKDLLFAQKISKQFGDAIITSPRLQEALFFRAKKSGPVDDDMAAHDLPVNPLLWLRQQSREVIQTLDDGAMAFFRGIPSNNFTFTPFKHMSLARTYAKPGNALLDIDFSADKIISERYDTSASWHQTLLTQCPDLTIRVRLLVLQYDLKFLAEKTFSGQAKVGENLQWCGGEHAVYLEKREKEKADQRSTRLH